MIVLVGVVPPVYYFFVRRVVVRSGLRPFRIARLDGAEFVRRVVARSGLRPFRIARLDSAEYTSLLCRSSPSRATTPSGPWPRYASTLLRSSAALHPVGQLRQAAPGRATLLRSYAPLPLLIPSGNYAKRPPAALRFYALTLLCRSSPNRAITPSGPGRATLLRSYAPLPLFLQSSNYAKRPRPRYASTPLRFPVALHPIEQLRQAPPGRATSIRFYAFLSLLIQSSNYAKRPRPRYDLRFYAPFAPHPVEQLRQAAPAALRFYAPTLPMPSAPLRSPADNDSAVPSVARSRSGRSGQIHRCQCVRIRVAAPSSLRGVPFFQ